MSDESRARDAHIVWKDQPEEDAPVTMEQIANRRAQQLSVSTRWDTLLSIAAPLFFVAMLLWRLPPAGPHLQHVVLGAAALWKAISLVRFRGRIWGPSSE